YIYQREGRFLLTDKILQSMQESSSTASAEHAVPPKVATALAPLVNKEFSYTGFETELKERLGKDDLRLYRDRIESESCTPSLGRINTIFGVIVVLSGLAATLSGGWAGDRLRGRFPGSYFLVSGAAMLVAFPMILLVLWAP